MARVGVMVWVTSPPGMTPEQTCREVQASISFGAPEARLLPPPEPAPGKLVWHKGRHRWGEHDGYPRHQHSINGLLTIAPHDTRVHFQGGLAF
jgi:hypothetical protein